MLKPFRELKISLAAKCQLLFGLALALIIGAALFAPWQRMEQLMEEIDRRAARTLTDHVLLEHVLSHLGSSPGEEPPTVPAAAAEPPAAEPSASPTPARPPLPPPHRPEALTTTRPYVLNRVGMFTPRLVGVWRDDLTRAERQALQRFSLAGGEDFRAVYYTRRDGTEAFRYTRALFARNDCLSCHAEYDGVSLQVLAPPRSPGEEGPPLLLRLPPGLMGLVSVDIPSHRESGQVALNRVFFLAAAFTAGALAILVFSLITSRFILQPVRVLQETAEKVSRGDLDVRSDIPTGDEFQQLSETFNTMLTNLSRTEAKLREANSVLDSRLTQLAETNVALAETNRLKSEFLANVSHELKTPLNSILGFADLLRKAAADANDAKSYRYAQNIHTAGTNLLALITDLLDLAKVEAGRMEVHPADFVLSELFEKLVSTLKPLTEPKSLSILWEIESTIPPLRQDAHKLQQILYNFLSNAIKFSPHGGTIFLRAMVHSHDPPPDDNPVEGASPPAAAGTQTAGVTPRLGPVRDIRISVTDQGPGIDPGKTRLIFEKFRQLDGGVTRQYGGTGLGLAISKELTALLGGTIGVESAPDEGATFWIVIPVNIEAGAAELRRG
ncbi:MAG: ATP-binding protein [Tepidisphaerales bacterium]